MLTLVCPTTQKIYAAEHRDHRRPVEALLYLHQGAVEHQDPRHWDSSVDSSVLAIRYAVERYYAKPRTVESPRKTARPGQPGGAVEHAQARS